MRSRKAALLGAPSIGHNGSASAASQRVTALNTAYRQERHCQIVDDRSDCLPKRQSPHALRIQRYDDRVSRTHLNRLGPPEPTAALAGNDTPIRSYDVNALAICLLRAPAAPRDVVVAGQATPEYMRRGALNFAQNGNLLGSLWNEQFIPISEQHILWPADPAFHDAIHVYHKPTHGLGVAQLGEQCLANCQTLGRAGRTVPTIRGGAAGDGLERERRQIALHSVGQQIELLLFTLLQFFSN